MRKMKAMAGRLLAAGVLAAGVVGLSMGMTGAAQASVTPDPSWNEIWAPYLTAQSNTLCVDDPSGSGSPGTSLQLFHCHGYGSDGAPQRWQFVYRGKDPKDGYPLYTINNVSNGLCISSLTIGGRLTQDTCDFRDATWELHSENLWSNDPYFVLVLQITGADGSNNPACMAAGNSTDGNHTPLIATSCDLSNLFNYGPQIWRLG